MPVPFRYTVSLMLVAGSAVASRELPRAERHHLAEIHLPSGVRLHYAEQGDPFGRPVILLHGYSDSWFSFSRVMPLMSAKNRVFAIDLRGHGESDRPATGYAMSDMAADVIEFMIAKGLGKATVVGHSMGSFVAQQVALAAPERVERLVLIGSATAPRNFAGMPELGQAIVSLADPVPADFAREFQVSTIHQPLPEAFMTRVVAESRKLPARVWRDVMEGMLITERPSGLGPSGIPALILWGDHDRFAPREEQIALLHLLSSSTLKVYRDTGHALHWERPEAFVRDLESFVDGVVAVSSRAQ
jgi:non-heme chloroperoxidase